MADQPIAVVDHPFNPEPTYTSTVPVGWELFSMQAACLPQNHTPPPLRIESQFVSSAEGPSFCGTRMDFQSAMLQPARADYIPPPPPPPYFPHHFHPNNTFLHKHFPQQSECGVEQPVLLATSAITASHALHHDSQMQLPFLGNELAHQELYYSPENANLSLQHPDNTLPLQPQVDPRILNLDFPPNLNRQPLNYDMLGALESQPHAHEPPHFSSYGIDSSTQPLPAIFEHPFQLQSQPSILSLGPPLKVDNPESVHSRRPSTSSSVQTRDSTPSLLDSPLSNSDSDLSGNPFSRYSVAPKNVPENALTKKASHSEVSPSSNLGQAATTAKLNRGPRRHNPLTSTPPAPPKPHRPSTKLSKSVDCNCQNCGIRFATATLWGTQSELDVPTEGWYHCVKCSPIALGAPHSATEATTTSNMELKEEHLACSNLLGHRYEPSRRIPVARTILLGSNKPNANKPTADCNICAKTLATGGLFPTQENQVLKFGVETICTSCSERYKRCSDCGGGGGIRSSVGKVRCRELFAEGRKTCSVSHLRQGALGDMTLAVWKISSIDPTELEDLIELCRNLWVSTVISQLATPETLEAEKPIATSFEEVEDLAAESFALCEQYLRHDARGKHKFRYIALRWAIPASRRNGKSASKSNAEAMPTIAESGPLIRAGKQKLAGFVIGEVEPAAGRLFLPFTLPLGSGESFKCTALLLQALQDHISKEIPASSTQQRGRRLSSNRSPFSEAWTLALSKKDSRVLSRLGYMTLDEYAERYPNIEKKEYPIAFGTVHSHSLLNDCEVLVKPLGGNHDWLVCAGFTSSPSSI